MLQTLEQHKAEFKKKGIAGIALRRFDNALFQVKQLFKT